MSALRSGPGGEHRWFTLFGVGLVLPENPLDYDSCSGFFRVGVGMGWLSRSRCSGCSGKRRVTSVRAGHLAEASLWLPGSSSPCQPRNCQTPFPGLCAGLGGPPGGARGASLALLRRDLSIQSFSGSQGAVCERETEIHVQVHTAHTERV